MKKTQRRERQRKRWLCGKARRLKLKGDTNLEGKYRGRGRGEESDDMNRGGPQKEKEITERYFTFLSIC